MAKKVAEKTKELVKTDLLWRKPITLEMDNDDDPLASLYGRREVAEFDTKTVGQVEKVAGAFAVSDDGKAKKSVKSSFKNKLVVPEPDEKADITVEIEPETSIRTDDNKSATLYKLTESDLKDALKIKSETFHFTDVREILRGKSLEIYAYLRFLAGDTGNCKIKHSDLMEKLNISRPTLFKQGEWLTRLSLIEKRNVPGDHFGTSYTVFRLEEVLPVPHDLAEQLELQIENFRKTA